MNGSGRTYRGDARIEFFVHQFIARSRCPHYSNTRVFAVPRERAFYIVYWKNCIRLIYIAMAGAKSTRTRPADNGIIFIFYGLTIDHVKRARQVGTRACSGTLKRFSVCYGHGLPNGGVAAGCARASSYHGQFRWFRNRNLYYSNA